MEKQTIVDNCRRVAHFYRNAFDERWVKENSAKHLIQLYGRILDVNGATIAGVSMLYVPKDEFEEVVETANQIGTNVNVRSSIMAVDESGETKELLHMDTRHLTFEYDGYKWDVYKYL